jgi:hypothetical protein
MKCNPKMQNGDKQQNMRTPQLDEKQCGSAFQRIFFKIIFLLPHPLHNKKIGKKPDER